MSKENGGPAFPVTKSYEEKYCDEAGYARTRIVTGLTGGMTLRDYFAAKAMQGMLANTDATDETLHRQGFLFPILAANAYELADAMLAERSKP